MYRNQMDSMYDRGSANMLGKVLIFVFIAIVLTAFGVIGFSHMIRDMNTARIANEAAQYQQEVREEARDGAVAAQNAQGQAEAIAIVSKAESEAAAAREVTRMIAERNTQNLAFRKQAGEAAILVGEAVALGAVIVITFAALRLVSRRLPAASRSVSTRPLAQLQPAQPTPARAPRPMRQAVPAAPEPVMLSANDTAYRPRQTETTAKRPRPASRSAGAAAPAL